MKKQLIMSVLFLILLGSFARAQNNIGIRMGYSNSSAKIDALTDLNVDQYRESGLNVAVFTDIPLGYGLYFQPEIVYNQMGFGGRESMDIELLGLEIPAEARISTTVDYIQLPLQLKYQFNESGMVQPFLHAGPTLAYAASAELQAKAGFIIDFNILRRDIDLSSNDVNRWEIGATGGAGLKFDLPSKADILVGGHYYHAFNNWLNDPILDADIYNKGLQIYLGTTIEI